MSELTAAIDANDEVLNIDTLPPSPYVQIDDEIMEIRGTKPEQVYPPTQEIRPPTIRVRRGAGGTTAASHADGATLEPVYGLGGGGAGGGGIIVDNQDDPPAEVTTLIAPGATIAGDEATLPDAEVVIRTRTTTLTDAQIKALNVTPIELVPAQGAGNVIMVMAALMVCDTTEGSYGGVQANADLQIRHTESGFLQTSTAEPGNGDVSNLVGADAVQLHRCFPLRPGFDFVTLNSPQASSFNNFDNEGLELFLAGTTALTGGNAANTLKVTVWYAVADVA